MEGEFLKWNRITVKTITAAEDIIISELYDIGLEGAEIEDHVPLTESEKEQMFVDILPETQLDDGTATLNFFVEDSEENNIQEIIASAKEKLDDLRQFMDIGEGTITLSQTEDKDWINNWKEFFHQFYIDDLLVIPSWEQVQPEDQGKKILHIDPGTAFGTGKHETTQLCIRQLQKHVTKGAEVLDVGTGSGILGIIALMFGAGHIVGTDLDPCAINASYENMDTNGVNREDFEVMIGNIITDKQVQDKVGYEKYDIVTANILAEVLVPLTPVVVKHMKPGAIYITSGIISDKEEVVKKAVIDAGLTVLEITHQGEWVSITARK